VDGDPPPTRVVPFALERSQQRWNHCGAHAALALLLGSFDARSTKGALMLLLAGAASVGTLFHGQFGLEL
jgi:hypothetical protein